MNPVNLSLNLLGMLDPTTFNFPHIFQTEADTKRKGRVTYRRMMAQLDAGVDNVTIHVDNTFSISYTNGAIYKSVECIGSTGNSAYTLQAILDSGVKVIVERDYDGSAMVLNDTADYKARAAQKEVVDEEAPSEE